MIFQNGIMWCRRSSKTLKNHEICQKQIWQKMKKCLVQFNFKTHFSADSGYPKIRFRVLDPSLEKMDRTKFYILSQSVSIYQLRNYKRHSIFLQRHSISYRSSNILLRFEIFARFCPENCNRYANTLNIFLK